MRRRRRSSNGKSKTCFDDLPPEMAANIFSRLPVKSLIRSTSVSKTWYSLIANPNFISQQISHSVSSSDENAVFIIPAYTSHQNYCSLVSAKTGSVIEKFEIPFTTISGTLKLIDSVDGLLFLTELENPFALYLWNPCLRKYITLDSTCLPYNLFRDVGKRSYVVGLGYHEPSHDYRIVRVISCIDGKGNVLENVVPKVEVFSLRMNTWREIHNPIVPSIIPRIVSFKSRTTVNCTMYGLSTNHPEKMSEEVWVLWFDFNKEVFGQLKLPDDVRFCLGENAYFILMRFEGLLALCVFCKSENRDTRTEPCCLWLMKNEDGIISWTKRFSIEIKEFGLPLKITKSGALIMLTCSSKSPLKSITSCDPQSMQCKHLGYDNSFDMKVKLPATAETLFVESLVMHVGKRR